LLNTVWDVIGPSVLAFWDIFVDFMDTVFTTFGWPNGFSQILAFIATLIEWVVLAVGYITSMLLVGYIFVTEVFVHVFSYFQQFIETLANIWGSLNSMWNILYPYWGWVPEVAVKIMPLLILFYFLWAFSPLLDNFNIHGTKERFEDTLGLVYRLVMFLWKVVDFLIDTIYRLVELVPVVE